mmetsp:Transcript_32523/g.75190  ORF Transcript_32523/g.75190 Transcript_32523/m.75190 type:complete len:260 (-) Transcript_32523:1-780(-)
MCHHIRIGYALRHDGSKHPCPQELHLLHGDALPVCVLDADHCLHLDLLHSSLIFLLRCSFGFTKFLSFPSSRVSAHQSLNPGRCHLHQSLDFGHFAIHGDDLHDTFCQCAAPPPLNLYRCVLPINIHDMEIMHTTSQTQKVFFEFGARSQQPVFLKHCKERKYSCPTRSRSRPPALQSACSLISSVFSFLPDCPSGLILIEGSLVLLHTLQRHAASALCFLKLVVGIFQLSFHEIDSFHGGNDTGQVSDERTTSTAITS